MACVIGKVRASAPARWAGRFFPDGVRPAEVPWMTPVLAP
jgi:hypothetical protein